MTGLVFPSDIVSPSWPFTVEYEDTSITSKFEDGSMQSRSKFTRSRRKWNLKWKNISQTDFDKLMDFVVNTAKFAAHSFMWLVPDTDTRVEVRITSVGKWSNDDTVYWNGSLELTEV